jgi:hypothetical protein
MNKLITFALIVLPLLSMGQDNLVPNGGFEQITTCPTATGQLNHTLYWINPNIASSDYYHECNPPLMNIFGPDTIYTPHVGVPANAFGYQNAHSGEAYVGMYCYATINPEQRDYVQTELADSIIPSIRYQVSFYASVADNGRYAIGSLGAHLSKEALTSNDYLRFDVVPQVLNQTDNPLIDSTAWILITDTFSSRYGGERFITIGNFNPDSASGAVEHNLDGDVSAIYAYYYIDDVSVIALDSVPSGVEEAEQNQGTFNIYPNPSNGTFTFAHTLHTNQMAHVEVYDLLGQCILTKHFRGSAPLEVDLTGVSSGLYTARILIDNELKFSEKVSVIRP